MNTAVKPIGIHCLRCEKDSYSQGDVDHRFCILCGWHTETYDAHYTHGGELLAPAKERSYEFIYEYPADVNEPPAEVAPWQVRLKGSLCRHVLEKQKNAKNGHRWAICSKCDRVSIGTYHGDKKKLVWTMLNRYAKDGMYSTHLE